MNRMADVVDSPAIAIAPGIGNVHRPEIVAERCTTEFTARLVLECDASRVLKEQQAEGVGNRALESGRRRHEFAWIPIEPGLGLYCARLRVAGVCSKREHEDER